MKIYKKLDRKEFLYKAKKEFYARFFKVRRAIINGEKGWYLEYANIKADESITEIKHVYIMHPSLKRAYGELHKMFKYRL